MTTSITIKDSTDTDCVFDVIRQPYGTQSAVLLLKNTSPGMNRTAFPKIELSSKVVDGRTEPVLSVAVPYGAVVNGNYVKQGQITHVVRANQPAAAPELARADAEAFARNALMDTQVRALFASGLI